MTVKLTSDRIGNPGRYSNETCRNSTFPSSRRTGAVTPGTIPHLRRRVENLKHPLTRRQGMLQHVVQGMNLIDRRVKQGQIGEKHHELSDAQIACQHFSPAPYQMINNVPILPMNTMPGQ